MSEFNKSRDKRIDGLIELFYSILDKKNAFEEIEKSRNLIDSAIPSDIIFLVDELVKTEQDIERIKIGVNKFLNLMYKTIDRFPYNKPEEGFLGICIKNNDELKKKLNEFRPNINLLNKEVNNSELRNKMLKELKDILDFEKYYIIKENILFPLLEKEWKEYNCVKIMWAFHDDIRNNLKALIKMFSSDELDIHRFNKLIGTVYFYMNAIVFRDEKILFPYISETIEKEKLDIINIESLKMGFPYYNPKIKYKENINNSDALKEINLKTGNLTVEQIILIFNHLPVDITFVDEDNKVRYFSTPKSRIFPRTIGIIDRDVANCHPPNSVHIVDKIVEAFRKGEKDSAEFWINAGKDYILIRYFAVRDDNGLYKGVLEVSQEIGEIQKIEGEKRLLDWKT